MSPNTRICRFLIALILCVSLVLPAESVIAEDALAQLPRLEKPLEVDARLDEWDAAVSIPVKHRDGTELIGISDGAMELLLAWNGEGLCLGGVVTDDEIMNSHEGDNLWQGDAIEFFMDGRAGNRFMTSPYSPGVYQMFLRPPQDGLDSVVAVRSADGVIDGIEHATEPFPGGYKFEILVPWSAFPDFAPETGASFGFQFNLLDYDGHAGSSPALTTLNPIQNRDFFQNPTAFIHWDLVDALAFEPGVRLVPCAAFDVPAVVTTRDIPVRLDVGQGLASVAEEARFSLLDSGGEVVATETVTFEHLAEPFDRISFAETVLASSDIETSRVTVKASVINVGGRVLGELKAPAGYVGAGLEDALSRLRSLDLAALAEDEPFRAAAGLGAAASYLRARRGVEEGELDRVAEWIDETAARLDVLEDGDLDSEPDGVYDLVALTAMPEAQVTVEFMNPREASVTFLCGSIPLAAVWVNEFPTEEQAEAARDRGPGSYRDVIGRRRYSVGGAPEKTAKRAVELVARGEPFTLDEADALRAGIVRGADIPEGGESLPDGMELFVGDTHSHTYYSDGKRSPVGLALEAMYMQMDFLVITDHHRIDGAEVAVEYFEAAGIEFPVIVGEEITTSWAHFNAYPLTERIPSEQEAYDIFRSAHSQGAVVQWNHPTGVDSPWMRDHLKADIKLAGMDAWEHMPPDDVRAAWEESGTTPVVVGSSDTHHGYFQRVERTIIIAPVADGTDVAEAVRRRHVVMRSQGNEFLFGLEGFRAMVWKALEDGDALRRSRADRLREYLRDSKIADLIVVSRVDHVSPDEVPGSLE